MASPSLDPSGLADRGADPALAAELASLGWVASAVPRALSPAGNLLAAVHGCLSALGIRCYLFGAQTAIFHRAPV